MRAQTSPEGLRSSCKQKAASPLKSLSVSAPVLSYWIGKNKVKTNRQGTELGQLQPPSLRCSRLQLSVSASLQPCPWPLPYNSDLRHLLHTTVQTDTDTQTLDFISDTHKQQKIKREGSFSLPSPVSLKHHCFLCEAFKEKTEIKWEGCKKCLVQNTICAMPLLFHELQK